MCSKCQNHDFHDYFLGFSLDCENKRIAALRRLWKNGVAVWCQHHRSGERLRRGKASALQERDAYLCFQGCGGQSKCLSCLTSHSLLVRPEGSWHIYEL